MPLSKVEMFPRRNASGRGARSAVVEGRSVSPKECVGPFVLHTVVEGRNVFPKESTRCDLSKVEWFSRRNVLGSKKVGGTGSVEGRIISPKECNSPINIRMGDYSAEGTSSMPRGQEAPPTALWEEPAPRSRSPSHCTLGGTRWGLLRTRERLLRSTHKQRL